MSARNTKGRPSGLPAFLAALTASNELTDADHKEAAAIQNEAHRRAFNDAHFRMCGSFHRCRSAWYDELAAMYDDEWDPCASEAMRYRLARQFIADAERFFVTPARTKEDCRTKSHELRRCGKAFGGLSGVGVDWRVRRPVWVEMIQRDAKRHSVSLKLEA